MPKLSALVVAHNEENRLAACLAQLTFADELVVVLDKCTDNSKAIAAQFTSHLIEGIWDLEGSRRNTGIDACTGDWIFEVDADEIVPPTLAAEIRQVIASPKADYYLVPIDNYVGKRLVRYGWGGSFGTSSDLALFRKTAKRWGSQRVHPSLTLNGIRGHKLMHGIIHHVDDNLADMLQRLNRYSSLKAQDLVDTGRIGNFPANIRRFFSRFFKCYIRRHGYREGIYGFSTALCAALFPILSYLKARELQEKQRYD